MIKWGKTKSTLVFVMVKKFLPPLWANVFVFVLLILGIIAEVPSWATEVTLG